MNDLLQQINLDFMPNDIKISISKQQISELPRVAYEGEIKIVDTPELAAAAVADIERYSLVGFDTETRPSFKKGKTNKVALMQIATDDCCYLFRLNLIGIGEDLTRLIENDKITKIGLSVHDDFNVMHRLSKVTPGGFVELQNMVKEYNIADISLQKIYAILFGGRISKSQRLTNWEAPELTPSQQIYAATDAWACLQIYNLLVSGGFDPAKSPYIVSEEATQTK